MLSALVLGLLFIGCNKDAEPVYDPNKQVELEIPIIKKYVDTLSSATLEQDDKILIWYQYEELNTGEDLYDYTYDDNTLRWPRVKVNYVGRLLDGTVFDEGEDTFFDLQTLVGSWHVVFFPGAQGGLLEKGLQVGDKIRFVMPSYWGFGPEAQPKIPANSPLDFEIEVLELQAPADI